AASRSPAKRLPVSAAPHPRPVVAIASPPSAERLAVVFALPEIEWSPNGSRCPVRSSHCGNRACLPSAHKRPASGSAAVPAPTQPLAVAPLLAVLLGTSLPKSLPSGPEQTVDTAPSPVLVSSP